MLLKYAYVLDFLKLAGIRSCPQVRARFSTRSGLRARAQILAYGYEFEKLISVRILSVAILFMAWYVCAIR